MKTPPIFVLIQAIVDGVSEEPEGVFRVSTEGDVEADQRRVTVAIGAVDNDGAARNSTHIHVGPETRDDEIFVGEFGRTDNSRAKPGEPSWRVDKGVVLIAEAPGNVIRGAEGNVDNGVAALGVIIDVDEFSVYRHGNTGAAQADVVATGVKESHKGGTAVVIETAP